MTGRRRSTPGSSTLELVFHAKTPWSFERKPLQETVKQYLQKHGKQSEFRPYESYQIQTTMSTGTSISATARMATNTAATTNTPAATTTTVTPPSEHAVVSTILGTTSVRVTGPVASLLPFVPVQVRRTNDSQMVSVYTNSNSPIIKIGALAPRDAIIVAKILDGGRYQIHKATTVDRNTIRLTWTGPSDGNPHHLAALQTVLSGMLLPLVLDRNAPNTLDTVLDAAWMAMAAGMAGTAAAAAAALTPMATTSASATAARSSTNSELDASVEELLAHLGGGSSSSDDKEAEIHISTDTWLSQQDELDKMFDKQSDEQLAKVPQYPMPALLERVHLFDHQIAGIRWLIHQEESSIPSYFTEQTIAGRKSWKCEITTSVLPYKPKAVRGGILADDMVRRRSSASMRAFGRHAHLDTFPSFSQGLGKTLQTIGLILAKPPEGFESYPMPTNYAHRRDKPPRCTLIVCPKSVAANWKIEINKHVNRRKPNKYLVVDMYFGTLIIVTH